MNSKAHGHMIAGTFYFFFFNLLFYLVNSQSDTLIVSVGLISVNFIAV